MARFICDTCRYCHPSACSNPERPNAVKCKDYSGAGGGSLGGIGRITGQWTIRKVFFLIVALLLILGIILLFVIPY